MALKDYWLIERIFSIVALVLVRRTRTTRTGCGHLCTQLSVMTSEVRQIGAADSSSGSKAVNTCNKAIKEQAHAISKV